MSRPLEIRLVIDPPQSGSWNMAVDEALMRSVGEGMNQRSAESLEFEEVEDSEVEDSEVDESGETPSDSGSLPVLRFYTWDEPTLSLGYFQSHQSRIQHEASESIAMVRRNSGGGAIVHHHELTYSFTVPESWVGSAGWLKNSQELYSKMHDTLISTLNKLGVDASKVQHLDESLEGNFLCFQRRAPNDVLVLGHKVCGSAQRKKYGAISQHGSIILDTSRHAPEISGINSIAQTNLQVTELIGQWSRTLSAREELAFVPSKLSNKEEFEAQNLSNEKFSTLSWNQKR